MSSALNSTISLTCSPCGSITLSRSPLFSRKAAPDCFGIVFVIVVLMMKGAFPVLANVPAAVLRGFQPLAMVVKHRIDAALVGDFAFADDLFHFVIIPHRS